ncbi:MAG: D-alanyl-D-alanine carboxypeptidase [Ruminococcaceae bacterium]|nr:D-alanyl-D-alanine carboxypeptidase [Oscillospiraceae bacterium]
MKFKKLLCVFLTALMLLSPVNVYATDYTYPTDDGAINTSLDQSVEGNEFDCKSAILMEANTGKILYTQNADEALPPASVTKVMTLLLVMEAIDAGKIKLTDSVSVSEHAASMGGSQIFLKVGEEMSVEDMLKSVVIASANDAACALAEFVCGSEGTFVEQMNAKAKSLGMKNTHFENTNGLDDTAQNHVTSARDIAIMSRELIKHKKILEYSSIWMDTVRNGAFGLTNTNRLVRFYKGCTGLKTGSTDKAGFCISATAEREGVSLICVIMGAPTRDVRNSIATKLLDRGFANFEMYSVKGDVLADIPIKGAMNDFTQGSFEKFTYLAPKGSASKITRSIIINDNLCAPLVKGDVIGRVVYLLDGKEIGSVDIVACNDEKKIQYFDLFLRGISRYFLK